MCGQGFPPSLLSYAVSRGILQASHNGTKPATAPTPEQQYLAAVQWTTPCTTLGSIGSYHMDLPTQFAESSLQKKRISPRGEDSGTYTAVQAAPQCKEPHRLLSSCVHPAQASYLHIMAKREPARKPSLSSPQPVCFQRKRAGRVNTQTLPCAFLYFSCM